LGRKKLGLIINPIAGIGGKVGLKGSDGLKIQKKALSLGAIPTAQNRAAEALNILSPLAAQIDLVTVEGYMGEYTAKLCGFNPEIISIQKKKDSDNPTNLLDTYKPKDTIRAGKCMKNNKVDLILFAGGDGTARDIFQSVGNNFPVLGIPAGVKIYSGVFGINPRAAGKLALEFLLGDSNNTQEAEVIDLDEDNYRDLNLNTNLYGYLSIPYRRGRVQNQKTPTPYTDRVQAQAIATDVVEQMNPNFAYLLGPGTTTRAVADRLGLEKTLIGVDIITTKEMVVKDVGEKQIIEHLDNIPMGIIISPTGGQGFVFGRGNQQISPAVIRCIKKEDIIIVCLKNKIGALQGNPLLIDTGEPELDISLSGYFEITTGYHEKTIYKLSN